MLKLLGLTYVSRAKIFFNDISLEKLASDAAKKNKSNHITGYLYFGKGLFIQYIEGPSSNVQQLFSNIKKDNRNEVLNVLIQNQLPGRKFPNWNMKWLNRNMIIEINLEYILTNYLVFSAKTNNVALNEKTVWGIIDKLSKMKNEL